MNITVPLFFLFVVSGCVLTPEKKVSTANNNVNLKASKNIDHIEPAVSKKAIDWTSRYSPDIPYYNRSSIAIAATSTANPESNIVGMVQPGDGGFIITCSYDVRYCQISFGGYDLKGFVDMALMAGEAR